MLKNDLLSLFIYFSILIPTSFFMGKWICFVLEGKIPPFLNFMKSWEKGIYRLSGINETKGSHAPDYIRDILWFHFFGFVFLFLILLFQKYLPLNPQNFQGLNLALAFNTSVSFMTNTNWQAYSGEASLSHFSQMVGLTTQNFLSAATGFAVMVVMARGLTQKLEGKMGSFGVDLVRSTIYILLPLSIILAILLMSEGVIQSFGEYIRALTLEGGEQIIPTGPAASQIAIKQLGTNGGGFFGVNSAHPFENPTPFSNFLQTFSLLFLPMAQVFAFGFLIKKPKEGYSLLSTMFLLFIPLLAISLWSEYTPLADLGLNFEGKEWRFSIAESTLWGVATTAASNGSVNAMHSSFTPLSGLVFIFQILTGEVIFGGVGSGLYGMILYVFITLFLAGLMVGRSPEWLGKKIEAYEIKLSLIAILTPSLLILIGVSLACINQWGLNSLSHQGPHGFSEFIYAFASASGNNGSAFAGFNANTPILNLILGLCMLVGRFVVIIPVILIAGSFSQKKTIPQTSGTFPTDSPLFVILLTSTILIFGALTFFPMLALGPIAEHLLLKAQFFF
jgi:potassium-transporting ATPase potassium-binding subunit